MCVSVAGSMLAGCAALFPSAPPATFDLSAPNRVPASMSAPRGMLVVAHPTGLDVVDSNRILARSGNSVSYVPDAQWSARLSDLLQARIIASLEDAGRLRSVARPSDRVSPDFDLFTEIRRFEIDATGATPQAVIEIAARIVGDKDGQVKAARVFTVRLPAQEVNGPAASAALNAALAKFLDELVRWTTSNV